MIRRPEPTASRSGSLAHLTLVVACSILSLGWSPPTIKYVAWSAVEFFPPDLARQVQRHHRRFDRGIARGLEAPPAWRAGAPGSLSQALTDQVQRCAAGLRQPIPLEDLVEEIGVLAVRVLDANDPLAVAHGDRREPHYAASYESYVSTILGRVRLVYYGLDGNLVYARELDGAVEETFVRSRDLYPFVGAEFYRTGELRSWRSFDDRSLAFGVAAVSLSHAMTDLANLAAFVWQGGGGLIPTPRPTPSGHVGPTVTVALGGGFPQRYRNRDGRPILPGNRIELPTP